ncbi:MAG: TonB-dependent receptor [Myxococcales bacterium]|nr:TonB-dependent receptor [Myxococcales bacterium]
MRRAALLALVVAAPARADEPVTGATETIVLVDHGPRGGTDDLTGADPEARDRRRALAAPEFVTVVHVDEREGETRGVADALGATVGADSRSLGGLGSFAAVTVRGNAPGNTQVSIDGVPLSRLGSVTADLARYDLDSFERIELYRGAVPVTLGGAGVGGALDLVSRVGRAATGERWHLSLGGGSFGARAARLRFGDGDPAERAIAAELGYAGATGDYTFFDDRGTPLTTADDGTATRANNGYDQLDGVVRAAGARGARSWRGGVRALGRRQGVPGTGWDQALATRLDTVGGTADGAVDVDEPGAVAGLAVRGSGFVTVEVQRFRDPDDELGTSGQDRRYLTLGGGAQGAAVWRRGHHRATAAVELRADHYRDREVGPAAPIATAGERLGAAVAVADDLSVACGRVSLEPALRLEVLRTVPLVDAAAGTTTAAPPRTELLLSPRLAARALATPDLAIKASVGRYARVPTALELFGDRGFIVGRPDLRTERGWSADLGAVFAPATRRGPLDRIYVEVAGFGARPVDVIALVTTGGLVTRPVNLPGATLVGVELAGSVRGWRAVTVTGNYTFLDARQRSSQPSLSGAALPGRPRHAAYIRVDAARRLAGHLAAGFADVSYSDGAFVDEANLSAVPARTLVGVGAKLELTRRVALAVELKNLLDRRVEQVALAPPPRPDLTEVPRAISDLVGFPLPGRALYVRADVRW